MSLLSALISGRSCHPQVWVLLSHLNLPLFLQTVSDQSQQDVSLHPILFKSYVPYFAVSYSRAETMLIYLCVYTLE